MLLSTTSAADHLSVQGKDIEMTELHERIATLSASCRTLENETAAKDRTISALMSANKELKTKLAAAQGADVGVSSSPPARQQGGRSDAFWGASQPPTPQSRWASPTKNSGGGMGGGGDGGHVAIMLGEMPSLWDETEVSFWMCMKSWTLGAKYAEEFRKEGIDGKMLLSLSEQDLETSLKITNPMHRRRLVQEISLLREVDQISDKRTMAGPAGHVYEA